jgi:hypothetical protein
LRASTAAAAFKNVIASLTAVLPSLVTIPIYPGTVYTFSSVPPKCSNIASRSVTRD